MDKSKTPPVERSWIRLPIIPTNPVGSLPNLTSQFQPWEYDTGFSGEALAFRYHLEFAGLDPDDFANGNDTFTSPLDDRPVLLPLRDTTLWLISNVPSLRNQPYRIELSQGVAITGTNQLLQPPQPVNPSLLFSYDKNYDNSQPVDLYQGTRSSKTASANWRRQRALLGRRALRLARLKVETDFDNGLVSIWTP